MLRFPFRCLRQMTMASRGYLWQNGETLTVGFVDANPNARLKAAVTKYAPVWEPFAHIKFKFLEDGDAQNADIRIKMVELPTTSYSTIGHQARDDPLDPRDPSMYLQGSLSDAELSRVIMHEFGHVLGAGHEHQRRDAGIVWDAEAVKADYEARGRQTNNINSDVIVPDSVAISPAEGMSTYDTLSIMHYPLPAGYTTNGRVVPPNMVLSKTDKSWINKYYPYPPREIDSRKYTRTGTEVQTQETYHFSRKFTDRPKITLALTGLKTITGHSICANIRSTNFQDDQCDIHLGIKPTAAQLESKAHLSNPGLVSADITSLETARDDPAFQVGVFGAKPILKWTHSKQGKLNNSKYIKFKRPFLEPNPVVIVWLKSLHYRRGFATRIKAHASDITAEGFTIHIVSSDDSYFFSAGASWVAYPSDMPGTHTGVIGPVAVSVEFPANTFTESPKLLLAATELNFDAKDPVDFEVYAEDLDEDGMKVGVESGVKAVYLALSQATAAVDDDVVDDDDEE